MTVYLTWPAEHDGFKAAAAAGDVRAVRAERASVAASRRAMRLNVSRNPFDAEVMVMPAHQLGGYRERPRKYCVRFSRVVKSVEYMP